MLQTPSGKELRQCRFQHSHVRGGSQTNNNTTRVCSEGIQKSTGILGRNEGTMRQDILFCSSPGRFGHKTHVYRKHHKILEVMADLIRRGESGWWERSCWDKLSGVNQIQIYKIPSLEGLSSSHDAPGKCLRLITPRGFGGRSRHKSIHQSSDPNLLPAVTHKRVQ